MSGAREIALRRDAESRRSGKWPDHASPRFRRPTAKGGCAPLGAKPDVARRDNDVILAEPHLIAADVLATVAAELALARELGVSMFAGEAEEQRFDEVLRDGFAGKLDLFTITSPTCPA